MIYTEFNDHPYEAHRLVYDLIRPQSLILDLGCATGYFGWELKKKECQTTGVEQEIAAAKIARKHLHQLILADLERPNSLKLPKKKFDYILMMDVLEHLRNRVELLSRARHWLKPDGKLIISTPNIAHISIRIKLLFGDFTYTKMGILDRTHVHFYTKKTLDEVLNESGWQVTQWYVSSDFGQMPFLGRILKKIPKYFQSLVTDLFPSFLGVQWVVSCKKI